MLRSCLLSLLLLASGMVFAATAKAVQDLEKPVSLSPELSMWLENSWNPSREAKSELATLSSRLPDTDSPWNDYALGVASLKLRDYRAAVDYFEAAIKRQPGEPRLLRAFIYGKVLIRDPRPATARLEELAESIQNGLKRDPTLPVRDELEFLAVISGYLQLPSTTGVNESEVDRQLKRIKTHLTDEQFADFEATRDSIQRFHESLIVEKAVEREVATEVAENERLEQLEVLADERVRLAERIADLEPRIAQTRQDRADALAEIRAQDQPLAADLASLSAWQVSTERDLWDINLRIAGLRQAARGARGGDRARWRWQADNLLWIASDLVADLRAIDVEAAAIASQRFALQQEYAATQSEYDQVLGNLNADWQQLRRLQTVNEGKTQRYQRPARASSGRAEAFAQKARTLATYYEFPVESERIWLLESVASAAFLEKPKPADKREEREALPEKGGELKLDGRELADPDK